MAIVKRVRKYGTKYQVKVIGSDGKWITETHGCLRDAQKREATLRLRKLNGVTLSSGGSLTVSEYFEMWFRECQTHVTDGWRTSQRQMFRDYISPAIGTVRIQSVTPALVGNVLRYVVEQKRGLQTQAHVYNVLRKMFGDAVENYEIIVTNPVRKKLKPRLPEKERMHLTPDQSLILLGSVRGKTYEAAVWLGLIAGLRVGEIQALRWENVDFEGNLIQVRTTYARKEGKFRDYPKGRRWHSVPMPPELKLHLIKTKRQSTGEFVVRSPRSDFMNYNTFNRSLKRYCKEAGLPEISTHELRHSTAAIWKSLGGASNENMRSLFAHSSGRVTDKYLHSGDEHLGRVASVIQLFSDVDKKSRTSPEFPKRASGEVDAVRQGC